MLESAHFEGFGIQTVTVTAVMATALPTTVDSGGLATEDISNLIRWGGLWLSAVGLIIAFLSVVGGVLGFIWWLDLNRWKKSITNEVKRNVQEELLTDNISASIETKTKPYNLGTVKKEEK